MAEVTYFVIDRLGNRERLFGGPPLIVYNNRPETTVADVIGLLDEARQKIQTHLARSKQ